jgi:amino acid permease
MKKVSIIISIIILAFIVNIGTIMAQTKDTGEKYFTGKWNLMVYGLPDGDTKMIISLEKKDDKLSGNLADPGKSDAPLELANIEVADSTFKSTFNAQGMDITLFLKIKDEKNVTGNMMDMFEIKGTKEITK